MDSCCLSLLIEQNEIGFVWFLMRKQIDIFYQTVPIRRTKKLKQTDDFDKNEFFLISEHKPLRTEKNVFSTNNPVQITPPGLLILDN